jgi:tetratricopeptide (TPR) repeat protein
MTLKMILLLIIFATLPLFSENASITEETQVFKTYPFSDPDPVPRMGRIYPYYKFNGYSREGKPQEWRVIRIENPYIKVLLTPQIGGKVWGAKEKSTGLEFIYWNKVVKFRNIAMRGPWTSGGIEFNFGAIGHTPTTSTPVDYLVKKNKDGSVSCILGAIDLPSRTEWRVHVRLPKDKAYFETRSTWYNPTPLHHSYYHWMNAAADSGDDLQFYYPGSHYINHDGKAFSWPKNKKGRDISVYKNNNFGSHKSYHVLGEYTEHFGGYWKKKDFGFGNWSYYDDKPGKKLWLWALSRQGAIWKDLLTDEGNNQYIEFQSGRLLNQAAAASSETPYKHASFSPYAFDSWNEIWFPVKLIGGIMDASPYGVLNVEVDNYGNLTVGVCALQPLEEVLQVTIEGKTVYTRPLKLKPMEVFKYTLKVSITKQQPLYAVEVGNGLLYYSSQQDAKNRLHRPQTPAREFNWTTAEGLFIAAEEEARQRNYDKALDFYEQCLEKEPSHIRAMVRMAGILYRKAQYPTAWTVSRQALSIDSYDAGANFVYALACKKAGRLTDAKDGFGWAARSMEYRSAAYTELAALYNGEGNYERAVIYAKRALDYNRFNLSALYNLAAAYRLEKNRPAARVVLDRVLEIDPLNHFARFELYLWDSKPANRSQVLSLIRNKLPYETFMELAMVYMNLGRETDAIEVLDMSPAYPIADYWLAFLYRERSPVKSSNYLTRAQQASPRLVFPFRIETIPVLEWAVKQNHIWKSRYYMGLVLWSKGIRKKAAELFESCGNRPNFAPFYLVRANLEIERLEWSEENKTFNDNNAAAEQVLKDFKRAVELDGREWRAWQSLADFYSRIKRFDLALDTAETMHKRFPDNYMLALDFCRILLHREKYKQCLEMLEKTVVLPYEGAWEGRNIYRKANLFMAAGLMEKKDFSAALQYIRKARLWPEHLGVGKPFDTDERLENYLEALCNKHSGKSHRLDKHKAEIENMKKEWNTGDKIKDTDWIRKILALVKNERKFRR